MFLKKFIKGILLFLLSVQYLSGFSQNDYTWWDNKNNWIRGTHWHEYINISPGFMGPNALPVPTIQNGVLSKKSTFKFAVEKHSSKGDETENVYTELYLPLYSDKVGFSIYGVPAEHYKMDTLTRDIRSSRDYDGEGYAFGDVYFSTYIQLLEEHAKLPDILLTVNVKTASGGGLDAARFTDAPAYFFDLSFGKTYDLNGAIIQSIRPHAMFGFFAWQTYEDNRRQNDAPVWGFGVDLHSKKLAFINSFGGYDGYLATGDKSFVYRSTLKSKLESVVNYELRFQQGFYDFEYTSFRIGCSLNIDRIKEQKRENKK